MQEAQRSGAINKANERSVPLTKIDVDFKKAMNSLSMKMISGRHGTGRKKAFLLHGGLH
jgi:hypothetical protein